jgi:hypothetical protein
MRPLEPKEWPRDGRFLDVRAFAFALYDESYSLDRLCEALGIKGKLKHEPTGRITVREIDYCREDVRATMDALNTLKEEFDQHPIDLYPDQAYSPASIAKAYLDAMGVIPPLQKFNVTDKTSRDRDGSVLRWSMRDAASPDGSARHSHGFQK